MSWVIWTLVAILAFAVIVPILGAVAVAWYMIRDFRKMEREHEEFSKSCRRFLGGGE